MRLYRLTRKPTAKATKEFSTQLSREGVKRKPKCQVRWHVVAKRPTLMAMESRDCNQGHAQIEFNMYLLKLKKQGLIEW